MFLSTDMQGDVIANGFHPVDFAWIEKQDSTIALDDQARSGGGLFRKIIGQSGKTGSVAGASLQIGCRPMESFLKTLLIERF